jgi:SURF1 family
MKRIFSLTLTWGAVLILTLSFLALGFWQLDRAKSESKALSQKPDQRIFALSQIAKPGLKFSARDLNALVSASGKYLGEFFAPNQSFDPAENVANEVTDFSTVKNPTIYDVQLLVMGKSAVLVVRGALTKEAEARVLKQRNNSAIVGKGVTVSIIGRYYPAEGSDRISPLNLKANEISRLDPTLFVARSSYDFYPGYLVLSAEHPLSTNSTSGNSSLSNSPLADLPQVSQLPLNLIRPSVAGFYWQHLIYVGIWWFFALITPLAPFFNKLQSRIASKEHG